MSTGHGGHDDHGHGGHGSGWTLSVELVVLILVILALAYWVPLSSERRHQQMLAAAETPTVATLPTVISPFGMMRGGFSSPPSPPPTPTTPPIVAQPAPQAPAVAHTAPPRGAATSSRAATGVNPNDAIGSSCLVFGTLAAGLAYYAGPGYIAAVIATGSFVPGGPTAALSTFGSVGVVGSAFAVGCAIGAAIGPGLGTIVSGHNAGPRDSVQAGLGGSASPMRELAAANWDARGSEATLNWLDQEMLARAPFVPAVGPGGGTFGDVTTINAIGPQTVAQRW